MAFWIAIPWTLEIISPECSFAWHFMYSRSCCDLLNFSSCSFVAKLIEDSYQLKNWVLFEWNFWLTYWSSYSWETVSNVYNICVLFNILNLWDQSIIYFSVIWFCIVFIAISVAAWFSFHYEILTCFFKFSFDSVSIPFLHLSGKISVDLFHYGILQLSN